MVNDFADYSIEDELKRSGYGYVVGIDEAGRGCEKPDAEVLTNNGWKFYKDIEQDDLVLSYTDKDTIIWQPILSIIEEDCKSDLISMKNRSVDICVTKDHNFDVLRRVFYRDENKVLKLKGFKFRGSKNILELKDNDYIPRGGTWISQDKEYFRLPSVKNKAYNNVNSCKEKLISMDLWLSFLGIFLSEGYTTYGKNGSYIVGIRQVKKESFYEIKCLLEKLPFKFSIESNNTRFVIRSKQLYTYLVKLGKTKNKYIPKEFKDLSSRQLNILIDWLLLGDGSSYKGNNRKRVFMYYTISDKLRNDFEEILLKAGWTFKTSIRQPKNHYINGRLIKKENCTPCYEIRLRYNNKIHVKSLHKQEITYSGKVFCLSLPKYHNFYVRRNGSGYFTGNCGSGPVVAAAVRIPDAQIPILMGRVKDSKKLSDKKRRELFEVIVNTCDYGIGVISNVIIDEINILEATKLAMKKALQAINAVDYVLIDGTVYLSDVDIPQKQVIKGDLKSISIASASIIAKVTRDSIMLTLHEEYPEYNWKKNKGYLTKEHIEAIKLYGVTKYHRNSFRKVGDT